MKLLPLIALELLAVVACDAPSAAPVTSVAGGSFGAARYQAGGISLDQAVAMVQSRYGAKVVRANTVEEGGRVVHYIRLISADRSRVWTVRVDAATGQEF